jgi:hypothetical protein
MQIHFNVTPDGRLRPDLQDGIGEIRTRTVVPKARMQHAQSSPVEQAQLVTADALVMPDILHEVLGWRVALAEYGERRLGVAPLPVKLRIAREHWRGALTGGKPQSQAREKNPVPEKEKSRIDSGSMMMRS